ncbi:MAG: serine hydrolase domain-containing protein [Bacteroidota bacterium]
MKTLALTLLLSVTCFSNYAQVAPARYDTVLQRLGREFSEDTLTAGLSIGIHYKGDTWFYNFGKGNPTQSSIYEIGSITKTFAGLVLAHAVSESKVALDDDIRKYMKGNFPNLMYNGEPIRLVNLANTSSCLPDNLLTGPDMGFTRDNFFTALAGIKPDTIPGTKTHHSNTAAMLLSLILENIYKEPIDMLIQRYVLDPLQMTNTSFGSAATPMQMMTGYNAAGKAVPYLTATLMKGTGSMRSNSTDMVKYLSYLQKQETQETRMVLTPTVTVDASTNKVREPVSMDLVNDRVYALSLNWLQYHPGKNQLRIWTDGGTAGFRSYIVMYPEKQLSFIFLSNRTGEKVLDKLYNIGLRISQLVPTE